MCASGSYLVMARGQMLGPRVKGLFPRHILMICPGVHLPGPVALPSLRLVLYLLGATESICKPRQAGQFSWGSGMSIGIYSCNKRLEL